jgi:hypothetical protein
MLSAAARPDRGAADCHSVPPVTHEAGVAAELVAAGCVPRGGMEERAGRRSVRRLEELGEMLGEMPSAPLGKSQYPRALPRHLGRNRASFLAPSNPHKPH